MMHYFSTTGSSMPAGRPQQFDSILPDFILADVVFGSPREDCAGTGICRIEAQGDFPGATAGRRECRRAKASLSAPDPYSLQVRFQRHDLCSHLLRNYFRHAQFHLPQSCELPSALAQDLQLEGRVMQPGQYAIVAEGHTLSVTFRMA
ncbi:MAG: hypothetical protein IT259_03515 [Saprospiraceae bacterium]|nr:hypothetical protein [Saprospiraceae bacterium]